MKISAFVFSLLVQDCMASIKSGKKSSKTDSPTLAPVTSHPSSQPVTFPPTAVIRVHHEYKKGFDFEGLLEERGADPFETFDVFKNVLSQEECERLMDFSKAKALKEMIVFGEGESQLVFNRVPLDESDLLQLISEDSIQQISKAMNHLPLTKFFLQDVINDEEQQPRGISLHMDRDNMNGHHGSQMIILLGAENASADMIYVTPKGLVTKALTIGDAVVHNSDVLHGVDNMKGHIFSLHTEGIEGGDNILASLKK